MSTCLTTPLGIHLKKILLIYDMKKDISVLLEFTISFLTNVVKHFFIIF